MRLKIKERVKRRVKERVKVRVKGRVKGRDLPVLAVVGSPVHLRQVLLTFSRAHVCMTRGCYCSGGGGGGKRVNRRVGKAKKA